MTYLPSYPHPAYIQPLRPLETNQPGCHCRCQPQRVRCKHEWQAVPMTNDIECVNCGMTIPKVWC